MERQAGVRKSSSTSLLHLLNQRPARNRRFVEQHVPSLMVSYSKPAVGRILYRSNSRSRWRQTVRVELAHVDMESRISELLVALFR